MTDHEAYIILNMLNGIGPVRLASLLMHCGTPSEIFRMKEEELCAVQGISPALAEHLVHWERHVDLARELDLAKRGGAEIITRDDERYPELLATIHNPPICLYVRGQIPETISYRSLAVVGTRNMTTYGQRMAKHLSEAAAFAGFTVVSGLAYGVDQEAHRAALAAGGDSVSVLGGGLARIQPQEHVPLAREIAQHGAVISEFPMEFTPTRHSFPMRNRIISGISKATLVIEAGLNSGSLITASAAFEQGRTIFAVPGQADNPQAAGCHQLIRKGAVLVENFDQILEEFDFLPGFDHSNHQLCEENAAESFFQESGEESLTAESSAILEALAKGDADTDTISAATGLPANDVMSALIGLELLRRVKKTPEGYHRLR